jgi:hypothetical protein
MFGKKKDKATDGAAAPEVETKAKAKAKVKEPKPAKEPKAPKAPKAKKKAKVNITGTTGPNFFAAHVEKFVLTVAALAVGYFVYSGFSAPGFPESKTPDGLRSTSTSLLSQISEDHWPQIAEERDLKPTSFMVSTEKTRQPTDPSLFQFDQIPLNPQADSGYAKRGDPKLLPAEDLVVKNVYGALAIEVPKDRADPFESLEDAEPIKTTKRSRNTRGAGSNEYEGSSEAGMGGPATGEGETKKPVRNLSAGYDLGAQVAAGLNGGDMGGMMGGMGGMMGGSGGMMGGSGGMMGGSGGMMGGSGGMMGGSGGAVGGGGTKLGEKKDTGPKVKVMASGVMFNAITALVPHKKMSDEFEAKFENTGTFNSQRDVPTYLSFEVQRVDVTADPAREILDAEWKTIADRKQQAELMVRPKQKWAVFPPIGSFVTDFIDPSAFSSGLTMPIPPMLLQDYRIFSKHPAIAWSWDARPLQAVEKMDNTAEEDEKDAESLLPRAPSSGGGMMGGMGGMMGGMGGMGGMMGGMNSGDEYEDMAGGMGGMMGSGGDYGGSGGMGGMGGMMGGGAMGAKLPQPEFKMVRCYDMLPLNPAEFGKVYRYRIRLKMRDPNYPEDPFIPQPAPNELEDEVWTRIAPIQRKDDAAIKANPKADPKKLRTLLETEWSEPSPPVMVRAPYEILASTVDFDSPRKFTQAGKQVTVVMKEAQGTVMATYTDLNTGATYAFEEEVRRGTVLRKKFDAEIIVPTTKRIKAVKDFDFATGAAIADIRGGYKLAGDSRDDPLAASGEFMILNMRDNKSDPDGRIEIANELDDMFLFRMYDFTDEKENPPESSGMGMGSGGSSGMGGNSGLSE